MKRYFLVLALLVCTLMLFAQPKFQAHLGIDLGGTQSFENDFIDGDGSTNMGLSPAIEVMMPYMNDALYLGGGLEYQLPRGGSEDDFAEDAAYNFLPIYVLAKYNFLKDAPVRPEAIVNLGYNLFMGNDDYKGTADLTGGIYWAVGAGAWHPSGFGLQLMYRNHMGGSKVDIAGTEVETDITQSNLSVQLGYRF